MSRAIDQRTNTKSKKLKIHRENPKKQLYNRLKLLDSIGKSDASSNIGSLRVGFKKAINRSIEGSINTSHPYTTYLEQDNVHEQTFDTATSKAKHSKILNLSKDFKMNNSLTNPLEIDSPSQKRKKYTSISTTMSSMDKKKIQSKDKIQSLLEFKNDKFTPSSNQSALSPESFNHTPMENINIGFTPMSNARCSIRVVKKKKKEVISKEIISK